MLRAIFTGENFGVYTQFSLLLMLTLFGLCFLWVMRPNVKEGYDKISRTIFDHEE